MSWTWSEICVLAIGTLCKWVWFVFRISWTHKGESLFRSTDRITSTVHPPTETDIQLCPRSYVVCIFLSLPLCPSLESCVCVLYVFCVSERCYHNSGKVSASCDYSDSPSDVCFGWTHVFGVTFMHSDTYIPMTMHWLYECDRNISAHFKNALIYRVYCISLRASFDRNKQ